MSAGDLLKGAHGRGIGFKNATIGTLLLQSRLPVFRLIRLKLTFSLSEEAGWRPDRAQWGKRPAKAEDSPSSSHAAPLDTPEQVNACGHSWGVREPRA
jgi:hypothetical protein